MEMMELSRDFKQTEAGNIPSDWEVSTIKEAFHISNNLRLPLSRTVRAEMQGPYPYYGPTRIQDHLNEFRVDGEYALIGEDGDHFLKYETMAMTQFATGRFNVNNHAHLIHGRKDLTSTKWFYYYFKHKDITPHLTRQGAGRFKLSKGSLEDVSCAFPPTLAEQEAIAEALSDADALIESLEQLIAKKRQIKQGAMQELLSGKRRLPGYGGKWETKTLDSIGRFRKGRNIPKSAVTTSGLPCVLYGEIYTRYDNVESDLKSFIPQEVASKSEAIETGDILFAGSGETVEEIGKCFAYIGEQPAYAGGDLIILTPHEDNSELLGYVLNSPPIVSQKAKLGQGSTVAHIYTSGLQTVEVQLPECEEQYAIATVLSDMDSEIEAFEVKLHKYCQIKQGMMHNLLTGRIRLI